MSRIQNTFEQLKAQNKKALITYITAGDPNPDITVDLMHAMVDAGASLLELGVPFSDPMADGPVIQKASERALKHNISLSNVIEMVSEFRNKDKNTPVIMMGYLNPIEVMGYENFAKKASDAGVDGALVVDFPPEESETFLSVLADYQMDSIFLLSPTTTPERIQFICQRANGFVYYVAVKGVTGSSDLNTSEVSKRIAQIKQMTELPVGVGFGIKDAKTAKIIGESADAVIVGSAIVNLVEKGVLDKQDNSTIIREISKLLSGINESLTA